MNEKSLGVVALTLLVLMLIQFLSWRHQTGMQTYSFFMTYPLVLIIPSETHH